ncbi:MAG: patatin-like phospholipase family protein [Sandaracinaceae bacterium]|nr:patatin-like phospholipase family protein [Sandaracinaceae bacterium]
MTLGLIMSGGGARGAYEVGVLSYILGDLVRRRGAWPLDFVCGTSVGAINGAFVAASVHDAPAGMARLESMWRAIQLPNVLGFNVTQASRLHRVVLGGRRGGGLFDATPMTEIIRTGIDYRQLARNLRTGILKAFTATATHVRTGKPICFVDRAPGVGLPVGMPRAVGVRSAHIMPHHVLASAAIPVVFPPVSIRADLYCDGGLRLNTPLSPAIHLGADKVFVIGLSSEIEAPEIASGRYPGLPFLLGKVLDAFMLDHVNVDLEELGRINELLADGVTAFGPDFVARLNEAGAARGAPPRRFVGSFTIRPSQDLGVIAADFLDRERAALRKQLGRTLLRLMDVGEGATAADLASYLLFDGGYAQELIALGRRDARESSDEIEAFLYS